MTKTFESTDRLTQLQDWYLSRCNGEWEHQFGVQIDTLDNPGWDVKIDLRETHLADRPFKKISIQREDDDNWLICWVQDEKFVGCCGPKNLEELLGVFLDWAKEK